MIEVILSTGDAIWDGCVYVVVLFVAWIALGVSIYGVPFRKARE